MTGHSYKDAKKLAEENGFSFGGLSMKNIFVITDPGLDPDDLVNAWLLAQLQKTNIVNIVGAIANLSPARERARLLKGVFSDLDCNVLVGQGTDCNRSHEPKPYEFCYPNLDDSIMTSQEVWESALSKAENKSITLLLISGLTDIGMAINAFPTSLARAIKEVYIMGGASWENDKLIADVTASNNRFDPLLHPQEVYTFFVRNGIPMHVLSRHAAYAAAIPPGFYECLKHANTLGNHLYQIQRDSLFSLWQFANSNPPSHRQNRAWFAKTFCNLESLPISANEDPWQFVKKLALYDPLATMWMIFPEMFTPSCKTIYGVEHQIAGLSIQESGVICPDKLIGKLKEILMSSNNT